MSDESRPVLIVAGEASSALYAKRLLEFWKEAHQPVDAFGIGDAAMEKLGFQRIGRSEDMAVVGFKEVLKHWGHIKEVFNQLLAAVEKKKPAFALLLDYPGFNLRLAKKLKAMGVPVVYYISPQVWAWKKGRIQQIQQYVDKMLVLFPFEKTFYQEHGVDVEFVGHPLLDELDPKLFSDSDRKEQRQRYGILDDEFVVGLMPGSRHSELDYNLQRQIDVARSLYIKKTSKKLRFVLFVAPSLEKEEIQRRLQTLDFPLLLVQEDPFYMIRMADIVLTASGTATIFVGLMKRPMIIMYIMNSITAFIARRLVTSTPFFGMVNIILGKEVGREYFQENASVKKLSEALTKLIEDDSYRQSVEEELNHLSSCLGERGATQRVAESLSGYFQEPS
ncbi:MAG: lipid-A-disaccharide synthase [Bdellovibrionales bacterium]|nr:lipid-A-disaccharide synthase [Bdellovibrionales bacterium]